MANKSSEHGGFFTLGTISHGTLRTQDLLRTFAAELERLMPFNGATLANEARDMAECVDKTEQNDSNPYAARVYESASGTLAAVMDELQTIAAREGAYFGTTEGDGSDFGFWACDEDADEYCDACGEPLEPGQIGKCDDCQA